MPQLITTRDVEQLEFIAAEEGKTPRYTMPLHGGTKENWLGTLKIRFLSSKLPTHVTAEFPLFHNPNSEDDDLFFLYSVSGITCRWLIMKNNYIHRTFDEFKRTTVYVDGIVYDFKSWQLMCVMLLAVARHPNLSPTTIGKIFSGYSAESLSLLGSGEIMLFSRLLNTVGITRTWWEIQNMEEVHDRGAGKTVCKSS